MIILLCISGDSVRTVKSFEKRAILREKIKIAPLSDYQILSDYISQIGGKLVAVREKMVANF